jgi:hypothetical protein
MRSARNSFGTQESFPARLGLSADGEIYNINADHQTEDKCSRMTHMVP